MSPFEKERKETPDWLEIAAPSFGLLTSLLIVMGAVWATADAVASRLVSRTDGLILGIAIGSIAAVIALGSLMELVREAWLIFGTASKGRQQRFWRIRAIGQGVGAAGGGVLVAVAIVTMTPGVASQVELNEVLYEDPTGLPMPVIVEDIVDTGYFAVDDSAASSLAGLPSGPAVVFVLNDESLWDVNQLNRDASSLRASDILVDLDSLFLVTGLSASDIDIVAFNQFKGTDLFSNLVSNDAELFVLDSFQAFPVTSVGG